MKKLILCAALALPFAAVAEDTCSMVASMARTVMSARQNGVAMEKLIAVARKSEGAIGRLTETLVIDAFGVPRFSTPANKQRAIEDFGNDNAAICYRAQKGGV